MSYFASSASPEVAVWHGEKPSHLIQDIEKSVEEGIETVAFYGRYLHTSWNPFIPPQFLRKSCGMYTHSPCQWTSRDSSWKRSKEQYRLSCSAYCLNNFIYVNRAS